MLARLSPTLLEKQSGYSRQWVLNHPPVPTWNSKWGRVSPYQPRAPLAKYLQEGVFRPRGYCESSQTELILLPSPQAEWKRKEEKGISPPLGSLIYEKAGQRERKGDPLPPFTAHPRPSPYLSLTLYHILFLGSRRGIEENEGEVSVTHPESSLAPLPSLVTIRENLVGLSSTPLFPSLNAARENFSWG